MGFVALFAATWITMSIFYAMRKSLTTMDHVFVYLIILTIGINVSWIVNEEWKLATVTKDGLLYTGYLLYRTFLFPLAYVILMNALFRAASFARSLFDAGVCLVALLAVDGVLLICKVVKYGKWNLFYDAIEIVLLQLLVYGLLKWYSKGVRREVRT